MNKLYILIGSFGLMLFWALCLIDVQANQLSTLFGFIASIFLAYYIKQKSSIKEKRDKLLLLVFPSIYLVIYIIKGLKGIDFLDYFYLILNRTFINGYLWAIVIFSLVLFSKEKLAKINTIIFIGIVVAALNFSLFEKWKKPKGVKTVNQITGLKEKDSKDDFNLERKRLFNSVKKINLRNYKFLNQNIDTVNFANNQKEFNFVMFTTTSCFPCKKALRQLPQEIERFKHKINEYYIFYSNKNATTKEFLKYAKNNQGKLKNKTLLFDYSKKLNKDLHIGGYPSFLITNNEGKILHRQIGYGIMYNKKLISILDSLNH